MLHKMRDVRQNGKVVSYLIQITLKVRFSHLPSVIFGQSHP